MNPDSASDSIQVLPYATVQPSSLTVEADVSTGGPTEDYWISLYKRQQPSVHGRVRCAFEEGHGLRVTPRDINANQDGKSKDWLVSARQLGMDNLRLRRPSMEPSVWHPKGIEAFDFVSTSDSSSSLAYVSGSVNGTLHFGTVSHSHSPAVTLEPKGHLSDITSAQFFPSGAKVVLTTSLDASLRLWNFESGSNPRTLKGHTRAVTSAALVPPQGARVLSTSMDGTLRLWDLATGEQVGQVDFGPDAPANQVVVDVKDPQVAYVALRISGGAVVKVDLTTMSVVKRFEDFRAAVNTLALSHDGEKMLVGDHSGLSTLYDLASGCVVCQWTRTDAPVLSVSAAADGQWLIGGADGLPYRVSVDSKGQAQLIEDYGCATMEEAEKVISIKEKDGIVAVAGGKGVVFYS